MHPPFLALLLIALATPPLFGQGQFLFGNANLGQTHLYTRIGTIDGPFAGPGIWAQMLVGLEPLELMPIGISEEHGGGEYLGLVAGGLLTVPGSPADSAVYVQMVAWDGTLWGTDLAAVPEDQLGRTDVVQILLAGIRGAPAAIPRFHQPAIVPVPEPATVTLAILAGFGAAVRLLRRSRA